MKRVAFNSTSPSYHCMKVIYNGKADFFAPWVVSEVMDWYGNKTVTLYGYHTEAFSRSDVEQLVKRTYFSFKMMGKNPRDYTVRICSSKDIPITRTMQRFRTITEMSLSSLIYEKRYTP